jgi:hypothetical protein
MIEVGKYLTNIIVGGKLSFEGVKNLQFFTLLNSKYCTWKINYILID